MTNVISDEMLEAFRDSLQAEYSNNKAAKTAARLCAETMARAAEAIAKNNPYLFIGAMINGNHWFNEANIRNSGLSVDEADRRNKAARNMIIYGNIEGISENKG